MSFNFGSTQPAFGSAPAKPTAFGTPLSFGSAATTTAAPGFGGFGSGFGQKPAFGSTAFGQTATAAPAPAFGASTFGQPSATPAFGSTFGTPATSAPAFGSSFGPAASSAPAFGSTFGAPATSAPAFGSTFGAPSSTAPGFGSTFGAPASSAPGFFGAAATTKPSLFGQTSTTGSFFGAPATQPSGLFGSTATTQATGLFGATTQAAPTTGLFGASTTSAPSLFSGFGTATTSAPSLFGSTAPSFGGFGTTAPSAGFGGSVPSTGFGTTAPAAGFGAAVSAPGFGAATPAAGFGTAAPSTGFGLFGGTTSAPSMFSGFGKTTATTAGFTGFGTGTGFSGFGATTTTTPSLFGTGAFGAKPATAPAPIGTPDPMQQVLASFYSINLFGDERDKIIKKWNMLQACWGTGKGYYNANQPPVDYTPTNPLYRFKSVGFVIIPGEDNSCGLVKLFFNKKEAELLTQKDTLTNGILGILGNKPNLSVNIEQVKALGDNTSEILLSVSEKGVTGSVRKILATDLAAFLNQPMTKQQLANVGVYLIAPFTTPTQAQLQEHLKNPPPGIEPQTWQSCQMDNPNPNKFMPAVINGATDLKKRMYFQQYETGLHRAYLEKVCVEIAELKKKNANSVARIVDLKQKHVQLFQRILKILIKQEATRRVGIPLQPEEEMMKARLEGVFKQMNFPVSLKQKISDIWGHLSIYGVPDALNNQRYKMDPEVQDNFRQFLKMEQTGINKLIDIVNSDMKSIKIMSEGLEQMQRA